MRLTNLIRVGDEKHPPTRETMQQIMDGISTTATAVVSDAIKIIHERIDIDMKELVLRNMDLIEILLRAEGKK